MKTAYKLLYLSLLGLLPFSSCSNDELEGLNSEPSTKEISIMASHGSFITPEPKTRTEIDRWYPDADQTQGKLPGVAIKWTVNDQLGVFGSKEFMSFPTPFDNVKLKTLTNDFTAKFTGELESLITTLVIDGAYYPYDPNNNIKEKISISIPSAQTYSSKSSISQYDYKACNSFSGSDAKGYSGTFKQVATLIRFVINEKDIKDRLGIGNKAKAKLESITLSSTNQFITGNYTYNLVDNSNFALTRTSIDDVLDKTLTLANPTITKETMKDGTTYKTVYAVVAPITSDQLSLSFKYGNQTVELKSVTHSLEQGKVYNIGLNKFSLKDATVVKEKATPSGLTNGNEFNNAGAVF